MIINGTDLSTVGFTLQGRRLPGIGGERSVIAELPGAVGGTRLGGSVPRGTLGVTGYLKGSSHADLLSKVDALVALLQGDLVIRFADLTDREWVGWAQDTSSLEAIGPAEVTAFESVRLEFALPDPTARAQAETTGTGTSVALELGTAPSPLRLEITNGGTAAITQVTVRVRDGGASGTILRELAWSGTLAINDVLVIDAETFEVTNDGANALAGLTAASEFPVADPDEGADHLTVDITGGGGHVVSRTYRKRWYR